ncbi:hypothetical protein BOTBODRAFT_112883 [Botryobasidium botryosum FD-172 SS1]|uniref:Phosphatidate cytidylyltransferase n=1 Tax=Botryobasidium botryosum (strain FD-172 SS1) TaxID=930990 RepID=A0A067MKP0_BOTB1|nr:hypothetical protein BOTBODRAFT_112883 [Botryobasidium botryosum FD-172 SS1]
MPVPVPRDAISVIVRPDNKVSVTSSTDLKRRQFARPRSPLSDSLDSLSSPSPEPQSPPQAPHQAPVPLEQNVKKIDWEIPRKTLHSSIGFLVLPLYFNLPPSEPVTPIVNVLGGMLVVVGAADIIRFNVPPFARLYERFLGFLMRDSEKEKINGVIWYLIGVIWVLTLYPRDVAVVSILILSWADTAASTFGRLYGRYTPALPKLRYLPFAPRKSLAGSLAGFAAGASIAMGFWGWAASYGSSQGRAMWMWDTARYAGSWTGSIGLSVASGVISAVAEALDVGSLDDNLTLPIISGGMLWAVGSFMKLLP